MKESNLSIVTDRQGVSISADVAHEFKEAITQKILYGQGPNANLKFLIESLRDTSYSEDNKKFIRKIIKKIISTASLSELETNFFKWVGVNYSRINFADTEKFIDTSTELFIRDSVDKKDNIAPNLEKAEKRYLDSSSIPAFSLDFDRKGDDLPLCEDYFTDADQAIFIHRVKASLDILFKELIKTKKQVISGPLGVGKTTIALAYVHSYGSIKDLYPGGVFWFELNKNAPGVSFKNFADAFDEASDDPVVLEKKVTNKIKELSGNYQRCLFVFDEVEDYEAVKKYIKIIAATIHHLIITSCDPSWENYKSKHIKLSNFNRDESKEFIKKKLSNKQDVSEKHLEDLAEECKRHPLHLFETVAYINYSFGGSLRRYFTEKTKKQIALGKKISSPEQHKDIHRKALFFKLKEITKSLPERAFRILGVAAVFGSTKIPKQLLEHLDDKDYVNQLCKLGLIFQSTDRKHYKIPHAICQLVKDILKFNKFPDLSSDEFETINIDQTFTDALALINEYFSDDFLQKRPYTHYIHYVPSALNLAEFIINYDGSLPNSYKKNACKIF